MKSIHFSQNNRTIDREVTHKLHKLQKDFAGEQVIHHFMTPELTWQEDASPVVPSLIKKHFPKGRSFYISRHKTDESIQNLVNELLANNGTAYFIGVIEDPLVQKEYDMIKAAGIPIVEIKTRFINRDSTAERGFTESDRDVPGYGKPKITVSRKEYNEAKKGETVEWDNPPQV